MPPRVSYQKFVVDRPLGQTSGVVTGRVVRTRRCRGWKGCRAWPST
ncbi:hypothetical protein RSAG8_09213, partial [Rhizoctonia solani AG-8 WAC10335]